MSTGLKKYSQYKDSGVEWLGQIPAHWEVKKLKYLIKSKTGFAFPSDKIKKSDESGIYLIRISDLNTTGVVNTENCAKIADKEFGDFLSLYEVLYDDILFAMTGGTIGKVAVYKSKEKGLLNQRVCSFRIKNKTLRKLIYFWMQSKIWKDYIDLNCAGGAQPNISDTVVLNLSIPLPPLEEQQAIADFLDRKTQQIERVIAQKEKMIALLKERKQIIIQQAVTKGLNPDVPLKDSGVEWLGEIPAHWEVKKLKFVLKKPLMYGANVSGQKYSEDLPRYIRISDFNLEGTLNEETKLSIDWNIGKNFLLDDGDILFARSGATVGKSYQFRLNMSTEKSYSFAGYLIKASPNPNIILSDFLKYFTVSNSFENWKNYIFNKATIENIGADKYSVLFLTVPSIEEQKQIVDFIEAQSAKIDNAINLQQQQIERLRELKTSLIDSAVTGKIKVY
ncbi:restriction endonuclease subunit S [Ornithobacterium rhinotracheale]|uniref:restriction endonuclease subunit S n=1 Tax=Ornithobacterium rhinotracheale TaxID=28251 RepID=UPI0040367794